MVLAGGSFFFFYHVLTHAQLHTVVRTASTFSEAAMQCIRVGPEGVTCFQIKNRVPNDLRHVVSLALILNARMI